MTTEKFTQNARQIRYAFRINRTLVMFVDFNLPIGAMADAIEKCSQVESVYRIERYPDGTISILAKMRKGYSVSVAKEEIDHTIKQFAAQ